VCDPTLREERRGGGARHPSRVPGTVRDTISMAAKTRSQRPSSLRDAALAGTAYAALMLLYIASSVPAWSTSARHGWRETPPPAFLGERRAWYAFALHGGRDASQGASHLRERLPLRERSKRSPYPLSIHALRLRQSTPASCSRRITLPGCVASILLG
jgi:hypothetical protein